MIKTCYKFSVLMNLTVKGNCKYLDTHQAIDITVVQQSKNVFFLFESLKICCPHCALIITEKSTKKFMFNNQNKTIKQVSQLVI